MAKGNDGNYLQHSIETEAAVRLAQMDAEGRLHIALTHGMAPFEPFETTKSELACKLLKEALKESGEPRREECEERPVVTAYRKTGASEKHYPNSAELLRAVIGTDKLSGGITEICPKKHKKLADAWCCSSVNPVCSSWREQAGPGGALSCPDDLQTPWLFTMDPMTYSEKGDADDNKLHRCDIDLLSDALRQYVGSGKPGIAALFVYGVGVQGNNAQCQFWKFVDDLAGRFDVDTCSYWLPHRGGNLNLAGLLYSGIELSSSFKSAKLNVGRT